MKRVVNEIKHKYCSKTVFRNIENVRLITYAKNPYLSVGAKSIVCTIGNKILFLVVFLSLEHHFLSFGKKSNFLSLELRCSSRDKIFWFFTSWQKKDVRREKKSPKKCLLLPAGTKKAIYGRASADQKLVFMTGEVIIK